ncbi:MAG: hypothetical protein AABX70_06425 [Nanoarchaeota archaeon]
MQLVQTLLGGGSQLEEGLRRVFEVKASGVLAPLFPQLHIPMVLAYTSPAKMGVGFFVDVDVPSCPNPPPDRIDPLNIPFNITVRLFDADGTGVRDLRGVEQDARFRYFTTPSRPRIGSYDPITELLSTLEPLL